MSSNLNSRLKRRKFKLELIVISSRGSPSVELPFDEAPPQLPSWQNNITRSLDDEQKMQFVAFGLSESFFAELAKCNKELLHKPGRAPIFHTTATGGRDSGSDFERPRDGALKEQIGFGAGQSKIRSCARASAF